MDGPKTEEILTKVPRLREGVDIRLLALDAVDAFLLSRVDGLSPAAVLAELVQRTPTATIEALRRLEALGVLNWEFDVQAGGVEGHPALAEPCDLSMDEKVRVLTAEQHLEAGNYWKLLSLSADFEPSNLKQAYFKASKVFHPDRYFGRELGSYSERLESVFKGLKQAYECLRNPSTRDSYVRRNPPPENPASEPAEDRRAEPTSAKVVPESPKNPPPPVGPERDRLFDERRRALKASRRKHFSFRLAGVNREDADKGRAMYRDGLRRLEQRDYAAAAASFKLAMTYDPHRPEYRRRFEEASDKRS